MTLRTLLTVTALIVASLPAVPASADDGPVVLTVTTTADLAAGGDGVGCLAAGDDCSLRAALQAVQGMEAGSDVEVVVPAGTYGLTIAPPTDGASDGSAGQLRADLADGQITLRGAGAVETVIDASNLGDRIIEVAAGTTLVIEGMTLTGGTTHRRGTAFAPDADGGAIKLAGSPAHLEVIDSVLTGNEAPDGGGGAIATSSGTVRIQDSRLTHNVAKSDGGAVRVTGGAVAVIDSEVSHNTSGGDGGGVRATTGSIHVVGSLVSDNVADGDGGALRTTGGTVTVTTSTLTGNEAAFVRTNRDGGGAINTGSGDVEVVRSTIAGNGTGRDGGGILTATGTISIVTSTVTGNQAAGAGGGVRIRSENGSLTIVDSTIADNVGDGDGHQLSSAATTAAELTRSIVVGTSTGDACDGAVTSLGNSLVSDTSCGSSAAGDLVGQDPLLGPLADNGGPTPTRALAADSPAIDAAGDGCDATDQRGVERPQGAACDIGAFELADDATPGDPVHILVVEPILVTDEVVVRSPTTIVVRETISVDDAVTGRGPVVIEVQESLRVEDLAVVMGPVVIALSEPIQVGDAVAVRTTERALIAVIETITVDTSIALTDALGCDATWAGSVDGSWHDPGNWQGGVLPRPGDQVCIDRPAGVPVVHGDGDTVIDRLDNTADLGLGSGPVLVVAGGTLSLTGAATLRHALRLTGGELHLLAGSPSRIGGVELLGGRLLVAGRLAVAGDLLSTPTASLTVRLPVEVDDHEQPPIEVEGAATLGGRLEVSSPVLWQVRPDDRFVLLRAQTLEGGFDDVALPRIVGPYTWQVEYTDTEVVVTVVRVGAGRASPPGPPVPPGQPPSTPPPCRPRQTACRR